VNFNLHKDHKIYVAGHKGLIGSAVNYINIKNYFDPSVV